MTKDKDFLLEYLSEKFSEISIAKAIDEEILEWVDDEWSDEYDSEYEWYIDHNAGEAENVVVTTMVNAVKNEHQDIPDEDIYDAILELFPILDKY
jgi:hypothetical protein